MNSATARIIGLAAAIYLGLFSFNGLTRVRPFSPDSMNYIDVARNIAAGRGIVQSTVGFNQPRFSPDLDYPVPMTAHPPLYPLLVGCLIRMGVGEVTAAQIVSMAAYVAVIAAGFALAKLLFDSGVGVLAAGCLAVYFPLKLTGRAAWSDALNAALTLAALLLVAGSRKSIASVAAGVAMGLALATRYASAPLLPVGVIFVLLQNGPWREGLRRTAGLLAGFGVIAAPLMLRNFRILHTAVPSANPSDVGLASNITAAVVSVLGGWLGAPAARYQMLLAGAVLALLLAVLLRQRRMREIFVARGRYVLILWPVAYLLFLVLQRTRTHFDPIDGRLVMPAGVALVVLAAALASRASPRVAPMTPYVAIVILALLILQESNTLVSTPRSSRDRLIADSPRLQWIADNTTPRDLIIGMDTVDVPFLFNHRVTISFSTYPYTDYARYEALDAFCRRHRDDFDHVWFIWRDDGERNETQLKRRYGPFVTDLLMGRLDDYAGMAPREKLSDAAIFEIHTQ